MNESMKNIAKLIETLLGRRPGSVSSNGETEPYAEYLAANMPTDAELEAQRSADVSGLPVFAIAIVGDGKAEDVKRTAASLGVQTYSRWKLTDDPRGDDYGFILHMWPGDTLSPNALYEYAMQADEHDLIFCDEDSWGAQGRCKPVFKCRPSRATQLSFDLLGSGVAVNRALYIASGGMRGGDADGRYAYNVSCLGQCTSAVHISKPLYSCGEYREITLAAREKLATKLKEEYVLPGQWRGSLRVEAIVRDPGVALIISNKNACEPLMRLLNAIDGRAIPKNTSILVADQGSTDARTLQYYDILVKNKAAQVYYGGEVPLPVVLNRAAKYASSDAAVFMANTVEPVSVNWIRDLLAQTMRRGAGAAGPKLIGPDGRLMHTGTVIGIGGWQGSAYEGTEDDGRSLRKKRFTSSVRAVSGLTAACMMLRMDTFFNIGCFDESFVECGFDTELCLRMAGRGYECIYAPHVTVRSHARPMRISAAGEADKLRSYDAMRETLLNGDPYYNNSFDYASPVPRVTPNPAPAILLNERYSK